MNFKYIHLVWVFIALFCLCINRCDGRKNNRHALRKVVATSNKTKELQTANFTRPKHFKSKRVKHVGGRTTKLRHIATRKVNSHGSLVKSRLPLTAKGKKEMKRQFILRPPSSQFPMFGQKSPFMMMRPPPLTQKTVVTTHIPRPPIAIPFNPLLMNHFMHSFHGNMHSPFGLLGNNDLMKSYEDDEEDDG